MLAPEGFLSISPAVRARCGRKEAQCSWSCQVRVDFCSPEARRWWEMTDAHGLPSLRLHAARMGAVGETGWGPEHTSRSWAAKLGWRAGGEEEGLSTQRTLTVLTGVHAFSWISIPPFTVYPIVLVAFVAVVYFHVWMCPLRSSHCHSGIPQMHYLCSP